MNLETQQFVTECLRMAAEDMSRAKTSEDIQGERITMAQIRFSGACALEKLEMGQANAARYLQNKTYRGVA